MREAAVGAVSAQPGIALAQGFLLGAAVVALTGPRQVEVIKRGR
jgi:hypothetical protein